MLGSLSAKTLISIHNTVECPSISPDGKRIPYEKNDGGAPAAHWNAAFPDLATRQETLLSEKRSIDDQLEMRDSPVRFVNGNPQNIVRWVRPGVRRPDTSGSSYT